MTRNPSKKKCKAWLSNRSRKCKRWAMRGKEVCYTHGGATPTGPANPHFKHGRYSKYMKPAVAEFMDKLRDEINIESVDEEILAATALFVWHMQETGEDWLKYARELLVAIVSFKEKRHRMMYGEKVAITVTEAQAFIVTVVNVIDKEISDAELKNRLYQGIGVPDDLLARAGIGAAGAFSEN